MSRVIADEILRQMGGTGKLKMMVGAKNFSYSENSLIFSIGKGAKSGINKVRITLDPSDTYTVEFMKIWGTNVKTIKKVDMVYNDMLMDVFENNTGFYLTLGKRN